MKCNIRASSASPSAASSRRGSAPWRSVGQSHEAGVIERSKHQATGSHLNDSAIRHPRADSHETRALLAHERHGRGWILGSVDDRDDLEVDIALGRPGEGCAVARGLRPRGREQRHHHRQDEKCPSVAQRNTRGDLPRVAAARGLSITSHSPSFRQLVQPELQGSCRLRVRRRSSYSALVSWSRPSLGSSRSSRRR